MRSATISLFAASLLACVAYPDVVRDPQLPREHEPHASALPVLILETQASVNGLPSLLRDQGLQDLMLALREEGPFSRIYGPDDYHRAPRERATLRLVFRETESDAPNVGASWVYIFSGGLANIAVPWRRHLTLDTAWAVELPGGGRHEGRFQAACDAVYPLPEQVVAGLNACRQKMWHSGYTALATRLTNHQTLRAALLARWPSQ